MTPLPKHLLSSIPRRQNRLWPLPFFLSSPRGSASPASQHSRRVPPRSPRSQRSSFQPPLPWRNLRVLRALCGAVATLSLTTTAFSQTPDLKALAKKVDAHYNHLSSLETRYTERYRGMGLDRTESGTLLLRKPGRMRWSYDSPKGKVFVLDSKYAIAYTPGDSQASRMPAKQLDDLHSPLRFLLGHTELAKELDGLTLTPAAAGSYTLSGTPKGMAQRIHLLSLTVDADGLIHSMRMEEADGATTDFTFTAMHENIPTKDSDFTFTPPPGVTLADGAAPI